MSHIVSILAIISPLLTFKRTEDWPCGQEHFMHQSFWGGDNVATSMYRKVAVIIKHIYVQEVTSVLKYRRNKS